MRDERGQIFVEAVLSMLVLLVLFFAIFETALIFRDAVYIERVAREAAREVALSGNKDSGYAKGKAVATMYFGARPVQIDVKIESTNVIVKVSVVHPVFGDFTKRLFGQGGVQLGAQAIYPWHDTT